MKRSGEVTVFLSAVLVLVGAVLLASWTAARNRASAVYAEMAAKSSIESCFAGFYRPLWEEYRILAFYEKEPLEECVETYLDTYAAGGANFLTFQESNVRLTQAKYLVEEGGLWVQESGADYMKYHVAAEFLQELSQPLDLVRQIRKASGLIREIAAFSEQILEIEEQLRKIKDLTQTLTNCLKESAQIAGDLVAKMQELKGQADAGMLAADVIVWLESYVWDAARQLEQPLAKMEETWTKLAGEIETFQELATNLSGKLEKAREAFQNGDYTGVVHSVLQEQIQQVEAYSSQEGGRYADVLEMKSRLFAGVSQLKALKTITEDLEQAQTLEEKWGVVESWASSVQNQGYELPTWLTQLGMLKEEVKEMVTVYVKAWTEEGLIRAVIGEETAISEKELSEENQISNSLEQGYSSSSDVVSALLFRAYLAEELSHFQEEKTNHALAYEVEYLLGGHLSDRENLLTVIGDLLLLRESVNLIGYLSNPAKVEEAAVIAAAVSGVAGAPAFVSVIQTGILAAWAFEDAVSEVKVLMQGEKVPLLQWFGEAYILLDYAGYLNVLLGLLQVDDLRSAVMDLIQATMQEKDETFDLRRCVYQAEVDIEVSGGGLFQPYLIKQAFGYDS